MYGCMDDRMRNCRGRLAHERFHDRVCAVNFDRISAIDAILIYQEHELSRQSTVRDHTVPKRDYPSRHKRIEG